jgi:hypothetical protein
MVSKTKLVIGTVILVLAIFKKGQTYEEVYGKERAEEIKAKIGERSRNRSKETLLKMSLAKLGKPSPKKGKKTGPNLKLSETLRKKYSQEGFVHPNKGKKISKEHRKNSEKYWKSLKGHNGFWLGKKRLDVSKKLTGRKRPEVAKKIRGTKKTPTAKKRMRVARLKYISERYNNGEPIGPNIGKYETQIINHFEDLLEYKFIRQHPVIGYFLDGYCPALNLAIEVDEPYHNRKKVKDMIREQEIKQELHCQFLRIKVPA